MSDIVTPIIHSNGDRTETLLANLEQAYGGIPQEIAAELAHDLRLTSWSTGAKHEVAPLIARCEALARHA